MRWSWRWFFHGHLVRNITTIEPKPVLLMARSDDAKPAQPPLEIARTLGSVPAAGLQRLAGIDGQFLIIEEKHDGHELWLHHVEPTIENMAFPPSAFVSLDPFDKGYTFADFVELHRQKLTDVYVVRAGPSRSARQMSHARGGARRQCARSTAHMDICPGGPCTRRCVFFRTLPS